MQSTLSRSIASRGLVLAVATAALLTSGCAAIRRDEARSTENLLAAAGFQARPADTPAKVAQLKAMPPLKMVVHEENGTLHYSYADPDACNCLWVGGPEQYEAYKRLAFKQQIAQEQMEAAEAEEDAAMNWGMWGPWGPW